MVTAATPRVLPTIPLTDRIEFYKNVSVEVGGTAGSTGNGGTVNVTHSTAAITTDGINSAGIVAQSVGGGGGRGGTGAAGCVGRSPSAARAAPAAMAEPSRCGC